jgi:hypothetical protein
MSRRGNSLQGLLHDVGKETMCSSNETMASR